MEMNGIDPGRTALVVFGTETGTAQDLAEEIGCITRRLHFVTNVTGFENVTAVHTSLPSKSPQSDQLTFVQASLSEYTISVFVIATTGQGEFPSNARSFWTSILKKKLSHDSFSGVDFAVVGLGDTSYPR